MTDFSLIIFDCDGVLVDSEPICNRVESAYCRKRFALELSPEASRSMFKGKTLADIKQMLEGQIEQTPPPDWLYDLGMETAAHFARDLKPVSGIHSVLKTLKSQNVPMCVASQSPPGRVSFVLQLVEFTPFFNNSIFTSWDVERPKPHPDLFLYAASTLGFPPETCAVIEDSASGVIAGRAAGMKVFGYAEDEDSKVLAKAGATVFHTMNELPSLLGHSS